MHPYWQTKETEPQISAVGVTGSVGRVVKKWKFTYVVGGSENATTFWKRKLVRFIKTDFVEFACAVTSNLTFENASY